VAAFAVPLQEIGTQTMRAVSGASIGGMATLRMDDTASTAVTMGGGAGKELVPGTLFANRYAIEQIVGRGGMGVVYRATDKQLDETVALKTLPGDSLQRSAEELERFKREIRLARQITHRNVLRTYDYGEADGVYFISMEYVRGYTLAELLEETPRMAVRPAMGIARQICRGLQAAHEEGIIHRDIKPQNVLVDQKGQVKIMDFGIARRAEAAEAMTSAGIIVGTPHYMSPEQVQGKNLDSRSDVYSMGVMMYEMLCGVKPFDSESLMGVLTAHLTNPVRPPIDVRPEIGGEINRIILRCLEKGSAKRFADAGELLDALDRLQQGSAAAA
jgi:serine/threonine-protein kinase